MKEKINMTKTQHKAKTKNLLIIGILGLLIVVAFMISMNTGYIKLTPLEVIRTLFGFGTDKQHLILFEFRLPRIIISVLVGMGLAVSGCVLQGISRNALADPGILGINAGAGLAVMLFISFFPSTTATPVFLLPDFGIFRCRNNSSDHLFVSL